MAIDIIIINWLKANLLPVVIGVSVWSLFIVYVTFFITKSIIPRRMVKLINIDTEAQKIIHEHETEIKHLKNKINVLELQNQCFSNALLSAGATITSTLNRGIK